MFTLTILNDTFFDDDYYLAITAQSHTFLTLVISFLLVSRVNTALTRYSAARNSLSIMFRHSRELIQSACIFSSKHNNKGDDDVLAQEWRHELVYRTLVLLRTAMAVIDYPTTKLPAWYVIELNGRERDTIEKNIHIIHPDLQSWSAVHLFGSSSYEQRLWKESLRVPIRLAYLVRATVHSQDTRLTHPIPACYEVRLHGFLDGFIKGYSSMRTFLTTPVPFPLVQMTKIVLFLYVFTIPFVLLADKSGTFAHVCAVLVMTYGFVGLEIVAIELDNPFGDDENDFDHK